MRNNFHEELLAQKNDLSMLPLQISHSPSPSTQPVPLTLPEGAAGLNYNSIGFFFREYWYKVLKLIVVMF